MNTLLRTQSVRALHRTAWRRPLAHCRSLGSGPSAASTGPFTWQAGALFVTTGAGLYYYFTTEKAKLIEKKQLATASYGKAKIGGPFSLIDHHGKTFTQDNLKGSWSLIYFGFTNCPDVCPDELDKMSEVVTSIESEHGSIMQPIFISCDPARDTVEQTAAYVQDFHPKLIGLTGPYDAVKATCKAYRVYFSTPPTAKPGDDYLVDHSIFFYLMNPRGEFVDAYGKSHSAELVRERVAEAIAAWQP
ncbi:h-sco1 [Clavulina sp. PMI_390]|nr:h-sco1 [Clavulina sp. PMI_390]